MPPERKRQKVSFSHSPCRIRPSPNDYAMQTIFPRFISTPPEVLIMKYLCLICAETVMEQMTAADAEQHYEEYAEFTEAIKESGHYLGCNRLQPPDAAITVRVRKGKVTTTDGPFAET